MKINLNSDFKKFNPYQQKNQNRIKKNMTYDVENPGPSLEQAHIVWLWFRFVVFKATFNDVTAISWRSDFLEEETGGPRENHRPAASQ
jgi:hypothetical protein